MSAVPKAMEVKIVAADWKRQRLDRIRSSLHFNSYVQVVDNPKQVSSIVQSLAPLVVILPLQWDSSEKICPIEKCLGFQIIEELASLNFPPMVILFDRFISRFPLSDYCRPFVEGVIAFLDESDPAFYSELQNRVKDGIERCRVNGNDSIHSQIESLGLVGRSHALQNVRAFVEKAALLSDLPVLITGESGTGKEIVARAIYQLDQKRSKGPFIAVNCSAVSGTLAESEFFGHKRGAFTGATTDRPGLFQAASRGVLFLDEISELDPKLQPKLLRVIQENRVLPVGEEKERTVDIRVIAATNKDLMAQVGLGMFRADLYQRLDILSLRIPELGARKEDIEPLVRFFIKKHQTCYRIEIQGVDRRVFDFLTSLNYQGNIRELENLVRKILFRKASGEIIEMADIPPEVLKQAFPSIPSEKEEIFEQFLLMKAKAGWSFPQIIAHCERLLLKKIFQETNGCRSKMASLLKLTPRTLFNKLRNHRH